MVNLLTRSKSATVWKAAVAVACLRDPSSDLSRTDSNREVRGRHADAIQEKCGVTELLLEQVAQQDMGWQRVNRQKTGHAGSHLSEDYDQPQQSDDWPSTWGGSEGDSESAQCAPQVRSEASIHETHDLLTVPCTFARVGLLCPKTTTSPQGQPGGACYFYIVTDTGLPLCDAHNFARDFAGTAWHSQKVSLEGSEWTLQDPFDASLRQTVPAVRNRTVLTPSGVSWGLGSAKKLCVPIPGEDSQEVRDRYLSPSTHVLS
jgi:hypothetical protein